MTLNHFVAHGGENFTLFSWGFGLACGLACLKFRVVKDSKLLNTYRRRRFSDLKYWSTCSAFTPWQKHIRIRSVNQVKGPEEVIGALWSKLEARFRFWVSCQAVCMHTNFGNVVCQYLKELSISPKYVPNDKNQFPSKPTTAQNLTE